MLVGPSGSGKSTLLHLAGLLDRPDRGEIVHSGVRLDQVSERVRASYRANHIGLVFQHLHLLPKRSALHNVQFAFRYGTSSLHEREECEEALKRVGLGDRCNQPVRTMSGGEQQRVAVARAIVRRPRLILADEPTGQLDEASGRKVIDALIDATHLGIAVLLVTHRPELSPPLAVTTTLITINPC